jgi:hypothetical protein
MIFLLISNLYFIANKSIQIQICTSHQTHDFSAYFLYRIIGNKMCTLLQTHNSSAFSFTNIEIPISTLYQTHNFSAFSLINQYKFKSVLRAKPMIFLLIPVIKLMCTLWQTHNFSPFSLTNIRIQIGTLCQTHDFSSLFYIS